MQREKMAYIIVIVLAAAVGVLIAAAVIMKANDNKSSRTTTADDITNYGWAIVSIGLPRTPDDAADKTKVKLKRGVIEIWVEGSPKYGFKGPKRIEHYILKNGSADFTRTIMSGIGTTFELARDTRKLNKYEPEIRQNAAGTNQGVKCPFEGYRMVKWSN